MPTIKVLEQMSVVYVFISALLATVALDDIWTKMHAIRAL